MQSTLESFEQIEKFQDASHQNRKLFANSGWPFVFVFFNLCINYDMTLKYTSKKKKLARLWPSRACFIVRSFRELSESEAILVWCWAVSVVRCALSVDCNMENPSNSLCSMKMREKSNIHTHTIRLRAYFLREQQRKRESERKKASNIIPHGSFVSRNVHIKRNKPDTHLFIYPFQ